MHGFPHYYHVVYVGGETDIFGRKKAKVNCETYHYMALLRPEEARLCMATGSCYVCGKRGHGVAKCPMKIDRGKYICEMMKGTGWEGEYPNKILCSAC